MRLGKIKRASSDGTEASHKPTATADPSSVQPTDVVQSNDDRAINMAEFEMIQELCGQKFTLDACANPKGDIIIINAEPAMQLPPASMRPNKLRPLNHYGLFHIVAAIDYTSPHRS